VVADCAEIAKDARLHVEAHIGRGGLAEAISSTTLQNILGHDGLQTRAIELDFTNVHIQDEFKRKP
jgi:hypothetical protein